jgi:hypothetical protein
MPGSDEETVILYREQPLENGAIDSAKYEIKA